MNGYASRPDRLVFLDTETSGLDPDWHGIWDLAFIIRDPDGTADFPWQCFLPLPGLDSADGYALKLGDYWGRHPNPTNGADGITSQVRDPQETAERLTRVLLGATLVGLNPDFDARFLRQFLKLHDQYPEPWAYRTLDVTTYAAGVLAIPAPLHTTDVCERLGIDQNNYARHSAQGDTELARDMYDAARRLADSRAMALTTA